MLYVAYTCLHFCTFTGIGGTMDQWSYLAASFGYPLYRMTDFISSTELTLPCKSFIIGFII